VELLGWLSLLAEVRPPLRMKLEVVQPTLERRNRRRSVVVVLNEAGQRVPWSRIENTPANLAAEIVAAGVRRPRWRFSGLGLQR
jgi:hypothetical protein